MQLAERESEMAILSSMLTENGNQRGKVAAITGPAGFGKTRTLHAFADSAVLSGAIHLSAACLRNEQNLSLGMVHQISQSLAVPFSEPPRALRLLQEAVFSAGPRGIRPEDINWIGITQGLWEIITERAQKDTVLITVDDIQYADSISLEVMMHFINRVHSARVFLVFTVGEGPTGLPFRIQTGLMHHPNCHRLRLSPYSQATISRIVRESLGADGDDPLAERIHRVSGGNALLAHALIEDQQHAARDSSELAAADAFTGSVRTLLYRIGPTPLRIVHAAAVLDSFAAPEPLAEMLHIKRSAVAATVDWLTSIGLMGAEGFRHPAARAAVLDSIEPEVRCELNGRAAQVLHTMGMQATVIADRLLEGGRLQEPWVLDVLREAADQALATDEYDLAVRYLRYAVGLSSEEQERIGLTVALAKAEWRINPSAAAAHTPLLLRAAHDGRLRWPDVHWLLMCMLWHGHTEEAVKLHALLEADDGEESAGWRTAAEQWLAGTHPPLLHRLRGTHRPASLPVREGAVPTGPLGRAVAVLSTSLRDGECDAALKTAEKVLRSARLDGCGTEPVEAALFCLVYSDRLEEAAVLSRALHERAGRRSAPTWVSVAAAFRAYIAQCRGELVEAVEYAELSLRTLPPRSLGVLAALPLATLIEAHTEMGDYEQAADYLRYPLPEPVYQTRYGLHFLAARGRYHAAVGQPHVGLNDFLTCGALMRTWELDTPLLIPWRLRAAAVSVGLKDHARARKLLDLHHALPHGHSPRIRGLALMVLASTKELRRRPPLLREAIDLLQESGHSIELAHALTRLSHALAALGETDKARLIGQQAHSLGQRFHAEPLRREAASTFEKGLHKVGTERMDSTLSPAEHRVASMAALGYTNREISKKAYITVSTVEQHLTRIYRKLNVNGRNDLPLLFSDADTEAASRAGSAVG